VWEDPAALKSREDATDNHLAHLQKLHDAKRPVLDDHVARESHKDRLRIQAQGHGDAHENIVEWYNEKEAYLKARPAIESVAEAQLQLSGLANYLGEKQMVTETSVAQLKADGASINADVYKTQYSTYTWEDPAGIANRENDVDAKWATLDSLSTQLKADLDAALAREQEKERLRLQWTDLAGSFIRWTHEQKDTAASSIFGYSLDEVQAYDAQMKDHDHEADVNAGNKRTEYNNTWSQMQSIGIKENAYSDETPDRLAAHHASLVDALNARHDAYKAELDRQIRNDHLCKEFADLVNSFSQWLSQEKDAVSKSGASKEDQLAKIEALMNDKEKQAAKIGPTRAAEAKLEEAGIEQNRHTSLTSKDVEIQYDGFNLLLGRKSEMLKELIELSKLRGVSAEEWDEFNKNFGKFDKSGDGRLDSKEFKALMYSVGEELNKAQTADIFSQYAQDDKISRDGYLELMVKLAGDSDTKENVLDGFKLLSNGKDVCDRDELARVMNPEAIEFIYATLPGDQNYAGWVEEVFSR
jgi:Ca2+-binding EF-hand superfamily protein